MALQAVFRGPGLGFFAVTRQTACAEHICGERWRKVAVSGRRGRRDPGDGRGRMTMARVCVSFSGDVVRYPLVQIVLAHDLFGDGPGCEASPTRR